jgi:hypothetical protein
MVTTGTTDYAELLLVTVTAAIMLNVYYGNNRLYAELSNSA